MALRSLVAKIPTRSTGATLGVLGRNYSSRSALDRYDVIRTFFNAQARSGIHQLPNASTTSRLSCPHTRLFHTSLTRLTPPNKTSESDSPKAPADDSQSADQEPKSPPPPPPPNFDNYPPFFRRLALSMPHLPRPPSRDDFLNLATGFWARARIRFKWFAIKSFRRFNADDVSAFITWFLMSQTLWIFVGTTTFFSVVFATANSLQLQHYIARAISDYLTSETGVTIIFESAIVPKWKDSRISFKNVFISRRPRNAASYKPPQRIEGFAAGGYDISGHPAYHRAEDEADDSKVSTEEEEDTNYSMFDLNVDSVDVTLSLWRWLDGKGLVQDAVIKGVRGTFDRRSVFWDPDNPLDPASFRHAARTGDFELESLQVEDLLVTVYQPDGFRPHTFSIFQADIKCFRKRWLFYDWLCAENIVGQFDNCLFSLHKPQSIGRTTEKELGDGDWGRMSRIRIDGVPIDHVQRSTTTPEGPISWITSGKVDAVFDIKFPRNPEDESDLNVILGEIADAITTTLERIPAQRGLAKPPLQVPVGEKTLAGEDVELEDQNKKRSVGARVVIDIDLRFRDLKAAVPLFKNDLSYVNNALIRPIVGFMNANRTLIPIRCRVVKELSDFDGSWTMWESGLMDEISLQVYDAMAYHVMQANLNRRIKTVSLWSLQMTAGAVLSTLRNLVDPMSTRVREAYLSRLGLYEGFPHGVVDA
ncbi:mitochondrial distribution and morphology proteins-domain-containing protein [Mycena amicta]|nr:mitochondrial distribution and morphology proteins-domain-containing protein [Mycena amicta]